MTARTAWGFGLATVTDDGTTLDVWYPAPELGNQTSGAGVHPVQADHGIYARALPETSAMGFLLSPRSPFQSTIDT